MGGWNSLLAGVGLVAFGFGLLSILLSVVYPMPIAWVMGNLGLGALLLVAWAASNLDALRERLSSGEARRAGKYGSSAVASTLLGIAILGMLGFLSTRYTKRFDWSEQQVHSLSDQSRKVLEALDRDVNVTAFFRPSDAPPVRDLLERYDYESERFRLEFADPNARPDLILELGLDETDLARGLVRIEMGGDSVDLTAFGEPDVTNALVKLTRTGEKKVYFVTGHNERPIEGEAAEAKDGYRRAAQALRNENYRVEELVLGAAAEVPEDADVLVFAGPTRPLLSREHAALDRYLRAGGAALVMIDPRAQTDLDETVRTWGVELGDDIIFDARLALFGAAATPFAGKYDEHPIVEGFREPAIFHVARSVTIRDDGPGVFDTVVYTGEESWAERDIAGYQASGRAAAGADDLEGPVPVLVAGSLVFDGGDAENGAESANPARVVVVGDSDFASNEYLDAYLDRDLFVNSVNWLLGDVESISIRPNQSRASRLQLSNDQFQRLQYLSLFVLPEAIAVFGVLAWWARRRGAGRS
ncbi:MAG: GldG family protein [Proteobacteria bacterium]|nr:GldG family protein [Pseudomonadota bacterium]